MNDYVKLVFAFFSISIYASVALGQTAPPVNEVKWSFQFAHGTIDGCSTSNVNVLFAGNDASVLFQDLAASFRANSNQNLFYKKVSCFLSFTVQLTRSRTLVEFRSSLIGSALKDLGTTGSMKLMHSFIDPTNNTYLVTPGEQKEIGTTVLFAQDTQVIPLAEAPFKYLFSQKDRNLICFKSKQTGYTLKILYSVELVSQRQNPGVNADITAYGIDSSVGLQDCPRRGRSG